MHVNHDIKHELQVWIIYLVMFVMDYCDLKLDRLNCIYVWKKKGIKKLMWATTPSCIARVDILFVFFLRSRPDAISNFCWDIVSKVLGGRELKIPLNLFHSNLVQNTFSTFLAENIVLQQQYRAQNFQKFSNLTYVLLVVENNQLLMENHLSHPTSSNVAPLHEANTSVHQGLKRWNRHRGCDKGASPKSTDKGDKLEAKQRVWNAILSVTLCLLKLKILRILVK